MIEWALQHEWLTFFLLCCAINGMATVIGRTLRTIMVLVRGWPQNPLLDADGDFYMEKKDDD